MGWSDVLCQFHPDIVGVHPDSPDDPFALLMHRINALKANPSCIIATTFVDTIQDERVRAVVMDLAEALLPDDLEYTEVVLHAHQNEFFDRCIRHHGYSKTYAELEESVSYPAYFDNARDVQHVHLPQYIADTPDMLCTCLRKVLQA